MKKIIGLCLILVNLACSDMKSRPETADKLKPILVLVNPPLQSKNPITPLIFSGNNPLPGSTVRLEFHFIGPEGMDGITLTSGEPEARPLTIPITGWTVATPVNDDYAGLRHVTIEATVTVPTADEIAESTTALTTLGFVRMRYTLDVSDGSRIVPIAGDFIVYRDATVGGSDKTLFGSSIDSPAAGQDATGTKLDISSTLKNTQGEPIKIGWFVSAGEIKNRRASATEWELPGSGRYTLVFTVRGKESRNGDIQIREVTLP